MHPPPTTMPAGPGGSAPTLTSVMARGRSLAAVLSASDVAERMVGAFGWDRAFEALLLVHDDVCERAALWLLEELVLAEPSSPATVAADGPAG